MTGADLEDLARAALAEASRWPARTPERRAAAHLWIACTIPPARSLAAVKRAVLSYGAVPVQDDALALLDRLTQDVPAATASGAAPTKGTS